MGKEEVLEPKIASFLEFLPRSAKNFFLISRFCERGVVKKGL